MIRKILPASVNLLRIKRDLDFKIIYRLLEKKRQIRSTKRAATPLKTGSDKKDEAYRASWSPLQIYCECSLSRQLYTHVFWNYYRRYYRLFVICVAGFEAVNQVAFTFNDSHSFPARQPRLYSDLTTRVQRSDDASASTARH